MVKYKHKKRPHLKPKQVGLSSQNRVVSFSITFRLVRLIFYRKIIRYSPLRKLKTMFSAGLQFAKSDNGTIAELLLSKANRHGLVTGATGTGKTVTLQKLAEQFSKHGVPVFAADIKGDMSGISVAGNPVGKESARNQSMSAEFNAQGFPVAFWDLFGKEGTQIKTSIQEVGATMLSAMLQLNETQSGSLNICFRKAEDDESFLMTLDDLRWAINEMIEDRIDICHKYGNVTAVSLSAIQRSILSLESQGGGNLFGEPHFDILDLMQTRDGKGVVNLLSADKLADSPKLYAMFLLKLLHSLFEALPEAGDIEKPKLVFFFDEAHLLFNGAPKPLLYTIERLVKLVRSKGVGVYFVTQSPKDIPDSVLSQLGNRIQHALRAYTPKDRKLIKASADAFRPNPELNIKQEITELGIGEALVSLLDDEGIPTITQKVKIFAPEGQIGPISQIERDQINNTCDMQKKYGKSLSERKQFLMFKERMCKQRGIKFIKPDPNYEYREGDYLQFVPIFDTALPEEKGLRNMSSFPICQFYNTTFFWKNAHANKKL